MVLGCILIHNGGDLINCRSCGYHTWVRQYGYTSMAVILLSWINWRTLPMRPKGGKQ